MTHDAGKHLLRILGMIALCAGFGLTAAACNNNQGGFSGSVGNTPNGPPLPSFKILGTIGTPFTATVSNARSSWVVQGVVPLGIVICNNFMVGAKTPSEIIATKTSSDNSLLSVEIISGTTIRGLSSTSAPFGNVSLQIQGGLNELSPPADPDLRIFVAGPQKAKYQALVEDTNTGFVIADRAPTLIMFDTPDGTVDGHFFPVSRDFGTFNLTMTLNGNVVATEIHGPDAFIEEPP